MKLESKGPEPIGQYLTQTSRRLAKVLSQEDQGPVFDLFEYCIREIIRNSAEHSRGQEFVVFGQNWPKKQEAEIVILDDGVGIAENLYDNEYIECHTNREALKFSMMPGISGVSLTDRIKQHEHWGNSGFGLYVTSRFCSEYGSFRIISKGDGLTLSRGTQVEHSWNFGGTCIHLKFKTDRAINQVSRISEIIEQGKIEAADIIGEHPVKASTASQLLASRFIKE